MRHTGFSAIAFAVEQALSARKIGRAVAARVVMHTLDNPERIPLLLARITLRAAEWFESQPATLSISGDLRRGQWTALVRFAHGHSLLVSAGTVQSRSSVLELTVFGNHGLLNCEAGDDAGAERDEDVPPNEDEKRLLASLRQAIQTRQAVGVSSSALDGTTAAPAEPAARAFDLFVKDKRVPLEPPFGVLLVAGDHTHQPGYAEAFASDSRCRIVGLVDDRPDAERSRWNEQYAARTGTRLFTDFREAVSRPDVHIVSICAEPERRAAMIVAAAEARKHLYLDKPLCASVGQASEIVRAVRQHRVLAHMFSQVHWDPASRVREVLASGKLGELQAIHCDLCFAKGHTGGATLGSQRVEAAIPDRFELPDAKRELTNIGVYPVVMLLALLRRRIKRVHAATGNYFFAEHQSRDMEDFGQLLMELDGGITASVTAARTGWLSHPAGGMHRVILVGSNGTEVIDAHRPRIETWSDATSWRPPQRDPDDPLSMWATLPDSPYRADAKTNWFTPTVNDWKIDVSYFLDHLQRGDDGEVTIEIAAAATEVLLAGYRSAATTQVVKLGTAS